jgi:hypothetical protein
MEKVIKIRVGFAPFQFRLMQGSLYMDLPTAAVGSEMNHCPFSPSYAFYFHFFLSRITKNKFFYDT